MPRASRPSVRRNRRDPRHPNRYGTLPAALRSPGAAVGHRDRRHPDGESRHGNDRRRQTMDARLWLADSDHPRSTDPSLMRSSDRSGLSGRSPRARRERGDALRTGSASWQLPRSRGLAASLLAVPIRHAAWESASPPLPRPATPRPTIDQPAQIHMAGVPETRVEPMIIRVPGADTGYLSYWPPQSGQPYRVAGSNRSHDARVRADRTQPGSAWPPKPDAAWVTDFDAGTVTRIRSRHERGRTCRVDGKPSRYRRLLGDSVWVAQQRGGSVTRLTSRPGKSSQRYP